MKRMSYFLTIAWTCWYKIKWYTISNQNQNWSPWCSPLHNTKAVAVHKQRCFFLELEQWNKEERGGGKKRQVHKATIILEKFSLLNRSHQNIEIHSSPCQNRSLEGGWHHRHPSQVQQWKQQSDKSKHTRKVVSFGPIDKIQPQWWW